MTIKEICNILKSKLYNNGFEYGFIVDGRKYKPNMKNGFDNDYYHLSLTVYTVQDPSVTLKEKIGTCVDAVLVMKSILDSFECFKQNMVVIQQEEKQSTHDTNI